MFQLGRPPCENPLHSPGPNIVPMSRGARGAGVETALSGLWDGRDGSHPSTTENHWFGSRKQMTPSYFVGISKESKVSVVDFPKKRNPLRGSQWWMADRQGYFSHLPSGIILQVLLFGGLPLKKCISHTWEPEIMISILCFFRVETCWKPPSNAGSDSTGRRHTQDGLVRSSEVKGNHLQQIQGL